MKICFLVHDINSKNGGGRFAHDLIYGVKNAGHEVIILKEEDDGFEGVTVLNRGLKLLNSALKIRRYIKNCDVIHALDGYPYGIIAALANLTLKKKLIISVQGSYSIAPLYNWKIATLLKWAYQRADYMTAISSYTKNELFKKVRPKNITIINHGVNLEKFHKPHLEIDEKFILSVGAIKPRKGYHYSIPAFSVVSKEIKGLKYKIVGDGSDKKYLAKLEGIAKKLGIENDIEFVNGLAEEELINLYQKAKIFVLTSININHHFEGFGLVFLEAAAAGTPSIGTKGNGIEDAIKDALRRERLSRVMSQRQRRAA